MVASTNVKITNDTGDTVTFIKNHDYHGKIKDGTPYPKEIKKGSTVGFVFENTKVSENGESSGAVVYRGKNENDKEFDWMYTWSNMDGASEETYKAYTEIASANHYDHDSIWASVRNDLMKSGNSTSEEWNKCVTEAKITKPDKVVYEGKMYLKGGGKTAFLART